MATFQYQARDGRGEMFSGTIDAASQSEAGRILRAQGKFIVKLASHRAGDEVESALDAGSAALLRSAKRIKRAEVISFCHQLAVMVDTGVPLKEALDCAVDQAANEHLRAVLADVSHEVQAGNELSLALAKYPKTFPQVMVSLIKASEVSGTMGSMLERVSHYLQKEAQTRTKVKRAMTLPGVMIGFAILVTIFLLIFILPRFASIYDGRGATLPAPTRFLMALSGQLINYWYLWLAGAIAAGVGWFLFARSEPGRRTVDTLKLNTPVIGSLFRKLYITRACSTMGTMLEAGVSMLDMVGIVRKVTENVYYDDLWDEVDERLRRGDQLSEPLFQSSLIPKSVAQMIYSGEKSGRLGKVLNRLATYTEDDLDDAIKSATQFIEPVMILGMGLIVGFIAMALLLPIFNVSNVVASG